LNNSGGKTAVVSDTLWELFQVALQTEQETGGLVSPTILDALVQAGYDRSFELMPADGTPAAALVLEPHHLKAIGQDPDSHILSIPENVHLDFGGLAKGWAAEKAVERLKKYGPALVNAGGDIAVSALRRDGLAWSIGVEDPFQPGSHFETLRIVRGGVATSGVDYHRWLQGGVWNHHLIDPRTGLPAMTDLLTVTIIAPNAIRAEAAAKVVLIAGSDAGMEWLEADKTLAGLLVLQSGKKLYSRRVQEYLWREYDQRPIQ
jgi:thiamine biosynthesis lipoprotein